MKRPVPHALGLVLLLGVALHIACAPEPESSGGIFGDRPVAPSEEESDASSSDATTDTSVKDTGVETSAPVPDAADDA